MKLVAFLSTLAFFMAVAAAKRPGNNDEGAGVFKDVEALFWDGSRKSQAFPNCNVVTTPSKNGNIIVTCQASGVSAGRGKAVRYDVGNNPNGPDTYCCYSPNELGFFFQKVHREMAPLAKHCTTDWSETITPSGQASLNCKFKYH